MLVGLQFVAWLQAFSEAVLLRRANGGPAPATARAHFGVRCPCEPRIGGTGRCPFECSVVDYPASMLSPAPIFREAKMIRKDDQSDRARARDLTRDAQEREPARDEAEEERLFAELARSPLGQAILRSKC